MLGKFAGIVEDAWPDEARLGDVWARSGMAGLGEAGSGVAGHGRVRLGWSWQGFTGGQQWEIGGRF